jgi:hypothetical protein
MPQLVAGGLGQPGAGPGRVEHLVQAGGRQGLSAAGSLQHHEHLVGGSIGRPFSPHVGRQRGEEPARDRDLTLVSALAAGDEHPPGGNLQIGQPQPEDLAAAQPTQHHRLGHGPVPVRAQRGHQGVDLCRFRDPRQCPRGTYQRHPLPGPLPLPPSRRWLTHHSEEHLQVIRHRRDRVRPRPHRQNSRYASNSGTPNDTARSPAAVRDRVRRRSIQDMQVPLPQTHRHTPLLGQRGLPAYQARPDARRKQDLAPTRSVTARSARAVVGIRP